MEIPSRTAAADHGTVTDSPIAEFDTVQITCAIEIEGYRIPVGTRGTVVAVYDRGTAFAVEIADLHGGTEVVILQADQIERPC